MNLGLSEDQLAIQDAFTRLFVRECPPAVVRAAEPLGFDRSVWDRLVEMGAPGMGGGRRRRRGGHAVGPGGRGRGGGTCHCPGAPHRAHGRGAGPPGRRRGGGRRHRHHLPAAGPARWNVAPGPGRGDRRRRDRRRRRRARGRAFAGAGCGTPQPRRRTHRRSFGPGGRSHRAGPGRRLRPRPRRMEDAHLCRTGGDFRGRPAARARLRHVPLPVRRADRLLPGRPARFGRSARTHRRGAPVDPQGGLVGRPARRRGSATSTTPTSPTSIASPAWRSSSRRRPPPGPPIAACTSMAGTASPRSTTSSSTTAGPAGWALVFDDPSRECLRLADGLFGPVAAGAA